MPINYSNSGFVDPNTQIKSTEIPLSGIEKGVEKLTKYYDAARDNETKTQSYLRKLKSSVHPVDQELAESLGTAFNQRIKDRVAKGNYEDMVWQTQGDAQDMAVMYDKLAKDSEQIRKQEEAIRTDKSILTQEDRDTEAAMYIDNLRKTRPEYLPQGRALTPGMITPPSYTPDVHGVDFIGKIANGWQFDSESFGRLTSKISDGSIQNSDGTYIPKGQSYAVNEQGKIAYISEEEMRDALNKSIQKDPAVMSSLRQSVNRSLYRQPLREGETEEMRTQEVYDRLFGSQVDFVSQRDSFTREEGKTSEIVKTGGKGSSSGGGDGLANNNLYSGEGEYRLTTAVRPDELQSTMSNLSGEVDNSSFGQSMLTISNENPRLRKTVSEMGKALMTGGASIMFSEEDAEKEFKQASQSVKNDKADLFNWMKRVSTSPNGGVYRTLKEGDANFFGLMNKLDKNPDTELTYDEKSLIGSLSKLRQSTGKRDIARSYNGLSSPAFNDYLARVMPEEMKDKTFGATNALDKLTTYYFGKDGEIANSIGIAGDFEVYDYQTGKKHNSAGKFFSDIVQEKTSLSKDELPTVNSDDKGKKSLKVQIKGIVNPNNPAGLSLEREGKKDSGTDGFINGLIVDVGGKTYILRNPEEKLNNTDLASGYSKMLLDEDAPSSTFITGSNGNKIPVKIKAMGDEKFSVRIGNSPPRLVNNNPTYYYQSPEGKVIGASKNLEELKEKYPNAEKEGHKLGSFNPEFQLYILNKLNGN